MLLTGVLVLAGTLAVMPPRAVQAGGPWYTHSFYVKDTDPYTMYNRGYSDGSWDNQNCTNGLAVLDFGEVGNEGLQTLNPAYYGYGTYTFANGAPFVQDDTIVYLAEQYARGWYNSTSTCPRLTLSLGTSNYRECPFGNVRGLCSTSGAGSAWADAAHQTDLWLHNNSLSGQINTGTADDMETAGLGQGWDCAGATRGFVDGYNGNASSSGLKLEDYGDFFTSPGCWSASDAWYVGWGAAWDWPLPEAYHSCCQVNAFVQVERWAGGMLPDGVVTQCAERYDPLPYPTCTISDAPGTAWSNLYNQQSAAGFSEGAMLYSTNIQYQ